MEPVTSQGSNKIIWSLVVFPVVGFAVWLSLNIRAFGHHFAHLQPNLELDYVVGILMWIVFAVGILVAGGDSRRMLLLGWVGKLFVALVAMLFYEQLYDSDSTSYFSFRLTRYHPQADLRDTDLITNILLIFNADPNNENIGSANFMRLFALITFWMPPYFHALKVVFAFFGFLGSWYFYRAVVVALGREYLPAFYLLVFSPSIMFWSSTLGKDPLVFLFIGLYAYGGAIWLVQGRLTAFWLIGTGILGVSIVRPWVSLMGMAALLAASVVGRRRLWQAAVLALAGAAGFYLYWENISLVFGDVVLSEFILQRAEGVAQDTARSGGSGGELPDLKGGASLGTALPWIIFTGLFRPLPFDITNPLTALAAAENTAVLCLALVAICRFRLVYFRDALVLWPILFCLMWATLYGLIVMANFGTGVRYKLQVWPFLVMVLLLLTHKEGRALLASRIPGVRRTVEHT